MANRHVPSNANLPLTKGTGTKSVPTAVDVLKNNIKAPTTAKDILKPKQTYTPANTELWKQQEDKRQKDLAQYRKELKITTLKEKQLYYSNNTNVVGKYDIPTPTGASKPYVLTYFVDDPNVTEATYRQTKDKDGFPAKMRVAPADEKHKAGTAAFYTGSSYAYTDLSAVSTPAFVEEVGSFADAYNKGLRQANEYIRKSQEATAYDADLKKHYADSRDTKQTNSPVDLLSLFMKYQTDKQISLLPENKGLVDPQQDYENLTRGFKEWLGYTVGPVADLGEEAINTFLDKIGVIERDRKSDLGTRSIITINNALVQLGETADLFEGAGIVKALVNGASRKETPLESLANYAGVDGTRDNYDYNTGNGVADFALELVSSPLNVAKLASKAVGKATVKKLSKRALDEALDTTGIKMAHEYDVFDIADKVAGQMKTVPGLKIEDAIGNVMDVVKKSASVEMAPATLDKLKDATLSVLRRDDMVKQLNVVKSVKGITDSLEAYDTFATKAAFKLTALTLPVEAIKAYRKLFNIYGPAAELAMNRVAKGLVKADTAETIQDGIDATAEAVKEVHTIMDVIKMHDADETFDDLLASATRNLQARKYDELKAILDSSATLSTRISNANKWAQKEGATDVYDWVSQLRRAKSVVPLELRGIADNIDRTLYRISSNTVYRTLDNFSTRLQALQGVQYTSDAKDIQDLMTLHENIKALATRPDINDVVDVSILNELSDAINHNLYDPLMTNKKLDSTRLPNALHKLQEAIKDKADAVRAQSYKGEHFVALNKDSIAHATVETIKSKLPLDYQNDILTQAPIEDGISYKITYNKVERIKRLLETPGLMEFMSLVRTQTDVGGLIKLLDTEDFGIVTNSAVNHIQQQAFNLYSTAYVLKRVERNDVLTDNTLRSAILDAVGGLDESINRRLTPEQMAADIIARATKYLDRTGAHKDMFFAKECNTLDTQANVNNILDEIASGYYADVYTTPTGIHDVVYSMTRGDGGAIKEITFGSGSDITTLVRADVEYATDESYLRINHNLFDADKVKAATDALDTRNNVKVLNADQFYVELADYLLQAQRTVKLDGMRIRLVGFNNSFNALGTDKFLSELVSNNNLTARIAKYDETFSDIYAINTADIAQLKRTTQGNVAVPNEYYDELTSIFKEIQGDVIATNMYNDAIDASYVSLYGNADIKLIDSIQQVRELIGTYLNPSKEINPIKADAEKLFYMYEEDAAQYTDTITNINKNNILSIRQRALLNTYDTATMQLMAAKLDAILTNLKATYKKMAVKDNGKEVFVNLSMLQEHTGMRDIMELIKSTNPRSRVDNLAVEKAFDSVWTKDYDFDVNAPGMATYIRNLIRKSNNIAYPMICNSFTVEDYARTTNALQRYIEVLYPKRKDAYKYISIAETASPTKAYPLVEHLFNVANSYSDKMFLDEFIDYLGDIGANTDLLHTILEFKDEMYNTAHVHIPGWTPIQSKYTKVGNMYSKNADTYAMIKEAMAKITNAKQWLETDAVFHRAYNTDSTKFLAQTRTLNTYSTLINKVNKFVQDAEDEFVTAINQPNTTEADYMRALQEYNVKVKKVNEDISFLGVNAAVTHASAVMDMDAMTYTKYLYKYALGKQIMFTDADIFKEYVNVNQLIKFRKTLDEAEKFGVHYIEDKAAHKVYIWLDNKVLEDEVFMKDASEFTLRHYNRDGKYNVLVKHFSNIYTDYLKLVNDLDDHSDAAFGLSRHSTMKPDVFESINNYVPKEVTDSAIGEDHFYDTGMFNLAYNHTILGDYTNGIGDILPNNSYNALTNIASGYNAAAKHLDDVNAYTTLHLNQMNSLRPWLETVGTEMSAKELAKLISDKAYVICTTADNGRIVKLDAEYTIKAMRTGKQMRESYIVPYSTWSHLVDTVNVNTVHNPVLRWLQRMYLVPMKLAMLSSTGMLVRNAIDSPLKGLVQAGDLEYLTTWNRSIETIGKFDHTLTELYKECKFSLNEANIDRFFKAHDADDTILDRRLFFDMYNFSKTSSASITAVQEELLKEKRIKVILSELTKYTEGDEKAATKHFKELLEFKAKYQEKSALSQALKEKYGNELGPVLYRISFDIPQEFDKMFMWKVFESGPIKKLMDANSKLETNMRMHTFLYHSEYLGKGQDIAQKMVDESQFNTSRHSKARKIVEAAFPFHSFAVSNLEFWMDHMGPTTMRALSHAWNMDDYTEDEMLYNKLVQYNLLAGNIQLDTLFPNLPGLTIKMGNSAFGALQWMANPLTQMADMLHSSVENIGTLFNALRLGDYNAVGMLDYFEQLHELEVKYYNNQHIDELQDWDYYEFTDEEWQMLFGTDASDVHSAILNLIPLVGVMFTRYSSALKKTEWADSILPFFLGYDKYSLNKDRAGWSDSTFNNVATLLAPTMFSVYDMDGYTGKRSTYPIGYNWYSQDKQYQDTHKFIYGISYVPSVISKNPTTYTGTYRKLLQMGYSREEAGKMMQEGWYVSSKDVLQMYTDDKGLPYWIRQDSATYNRTLQHFMDEGMSMKEAYELIVEGWYVAYNGALVDNTEQTAIDAEDWEQLQAYFRGESPFPSTRIATKDQITPSFDSMNNRDDMWAELHQKTLGKTSEEIYIDKYGVVPQDKWLVTDKLPKYLRDSLTAADAETVKDYVLPYWITRDTDSYLRTKQHFTDLGFTEREARDKIKAGLYVTKDGELVDRSEQNKVDAANYQQMILFQKGLAPFPTGYITKDNMGEYGYGVTWEDAFEARNGFKPGEMWLNPITGEVYFKGNRHNYSSGYKNYTTPHAKRGGKMNSWYNSLNKSYRSGPKSLKHYNTVRIMRPVHVRRWKVNSEFRERFATTRAGITMSRAAMMQYNQHTQSGVRDYLNANRWKYIRQAARIAKIKNGYRRY